MTETIPDPLWISPATPGDVAAALRRAADARQAIQIRGAGTKSHWGRTPDRVDLVLDMRGLNRILAHEHGDMTATVEAGATLRDVNRTLAEHGQWLPLDPPFADQATIGGVLATNDSGPVRHRYGTPRDLIIGIRLATTDGVLSKAGGQVVKNVAGYDLGKLLTGSFGGLAAIVSATFKLAPLPSASKTLVLHVANPKDAARVVTTMMTSQLEPIAFEIAAEMTDAPTRSSSSRFACRILACFASLFAVVDAQIAQATAALKQYAIDATVIDGTAEAAAWREHSDDIWSDAEAALVRVSWLPAHIEATLTALADCAGDVALIGRAAVGAGVIRIAGDEAAQVKTIEGLRASRALGNVVVMRGSPTLKECVDVWGPDGGRGRLFDSLKHALDPNRVLVGQGPL